MGLTTISTKSKALIALGAFLFITGLISAIVCGVLIVHPALKFIGFKETMCTVESLTRAGNKMCDKVPYPCAKIMIKLTGIGDNTSRMVYYDDKAIEEKTGCTFVACEKELAENVQKVSYLSEMYGARTNAYDCLYNADNKEEIIIKPWYNKMDMIHSLVWTLFATLLGIALLVFMIHKEKKKIMVMCIKAQA